MIKNQDMLLYFNFINILKKTERSNATGDQIEIFKFIQSLNTILEKNSFIKKIYQKKNIEMLLNLNKFGQIKSLVTSRTPKMNENMQDKKKIKSLKNLSRDMKEKITAVMPAAGLAATFVIHLALAHLKAAATVSNLLSNMALGSVVIGMVRDMILGSNNKHPNVKYIYESDRYDSSISPWPLPNGNSNT